MTDPDFSPLSSRILGLLESIVRLLRPEFWVVSVFPGYVGWVLARRTIAPDFDDLSFALRFNEPGLVVQWGLWHLEVAAVLITLGPLLGGSIMVTNDYFDRKVDVFNPKKIRSPLVAGTASPGLALSLMVVLMAATLVAGFAIDPMFGWLMVIGEAMSLAYSAPPIRLKARPLGDVLVNAFGYGILATYAGWILGDGAVDALPLASFLIVALSIAAGYIPTVMMDHQPDRTAGLETTATRFGLRASWIIGLECLIAANVLMAALALAGLYVTPTFLLAQILFFVIEVWAYFVFVASTSAKDLFIGGGLTIACFFANLGAFLLSYTGEWPF